MKTLAGRSFVVFSWLLVGTFSQLLAQAPMPDSPAIEARAQAIVDKMTVEEKLAYIGGTGFAARAVPRVGLPSLEMSDGPFGTRSNAGLPSTTYAAGIGLAASWNPELAAEVGKGIGRDAKARGVHFMLGPGVNIYRSPRNGRNFEYFGEDPFLTSAIAVGYITGMQTQGVSATVKHYVGNNSEFLRHDSDTIVDEHTAREIYMPAFEAAVTKGDVGAVMDSYNLIDGKHATQNGYFNIDVLRKDWGFKNTLMSDWVATYDGVAAANGGLDIEMPTGAWMSPETLGKALKDGTVKQATIDEKIRHILVTAIRFGWLDRPQMDATVSYDDSANDRVALESARESVVLLKNEGGVLPLDKTSLKSVLVVGPNALYGVAVGGGSAGVKPIHLVGPLEGISMAGSGAGAGKVTVLYSRGLKTLEEYANATEFKTEADGGTAGLKVETFATADFTGAAKTAAAKHINFTGTSWANISADFSLDDIGAILAVHNEVSRRSTGYYIPSAAGKYIVALQGSGEGTKNRVYVDGKEVIDDWALVRAFQPHVTLDLAAGAHKIVVEDQQTGIIGGRLAVAIVAADAVVDPKIVEMAAKADAVVIAAGYDPDSEGEGGDRTFELPMGEDELISAIAAVNRNTVVAINSGGNVDSQSWIDAVPAVVETWYGGQDGGTALGEVLFGAVNPAGHLPVTFERKAEDNPTFANYYPPDGSVKVAYKEGVFVGYRGYEHNKTVPLFPFGYGLSYTTFSFSTLTVKGSGAAATVAFDVTNTGKMAGADVAQVYVGLVKGMENEPAKELKGFERVMLQPGQTKHVTVALDAPAFSHYDVKAKAWKVGTGSWNVMVGDSSVSLPLKGMVEITKNVAAK